MLMHFENLERPIGTPQQEAALLECFAGRELPTSWAAMALAAVRDEVSRDDAFDIAELIGQVLDTLRPKTGAGQLSYCVHAESAVCGMARMGRSYRLECHSAIELVTLGMQADAAVEADRAGLITQWTERQIEAPSCN